MKSKPQGSYRLHQFPPLRKAWQLDSFGHQPLDASEYQQQLMAGFQQGLQEGFAQGEEQGMKEGVIAGRSSGFLQGHQEGKQHAHQEFSQATQPVDALVKQLQQVIGEHEQRRRSELLQLVEKVTRQVIRCELALHPTQLLALVEEALTSLPEPPTRLRVLLNPEEFARIRELEPAKVSEWGLTADETLEPGECRIVTESAEMDVGCHHRLNQCMDVLQQNLMAADGVTPGG